MMSNGSPCRVAHATRCPPPLLPQYLGIDVVDDADLLYIAEWALTAPLPEGWTVHLDGEGNEFFYNAATNQSTYEHPVGG